MTVQLLSVPFRVLANGQAATVEEGSTVEIAERLATIVQTVSGEYPMLEDFGISDPTWFGIDASGVQATLDRYGPPGVQVTGLDVEPAPDGITSFARVTFEDENNQGAERG